MTPQVTIPDGYGGGFTVVRMFGDLVYRNVTGSQELQIAFGVAVMTVDALVAGAVPDPNTDLVDWYYHKRLYGFRANIEAVSNPFEIRTARKIRGEDRTLGFVLDNIGANTLNFSFNFRLLLMRS